MNPLEKSLCIGHPYHCKLYYNDSATAYKQTERLFTGLRKYSDSTRANAFQHAVWNALMVESDNGDASLAQDFSTAHENNAYDETNPDLLERYRSRMDMENNATGNAFGRRWSPTKDDRFMCQGMLDNNINSGEYIGADTDPYDYMYYHALSPRQEIWRKRQTSDGVQVNPTGLNC